MLRVRNPNIVRCISVFQLQLDPALCFARLTKKPCDMMSSYTSLIITLSSISSLGVKHSGIFESAFKFRQHTRDAEFDYFIFEIHA